MLCATNEDSSVKCPQADDRRVRAAGTSSAEQEVMSVLSHHLESPFSTSPATPGSTRVSVGTAESTSSSVPEDFLLLRPWNAQFPCTIILATPGLFPTLQPQERMLRDLPCIPQKEQSEAVLCSESNTTCRVLGMSFPCSLSSIWHHLPQQNQKKQ